ncbi:hypothetical protein H4R34_000679 [Dimargaris verticillata]|uniref:threonine--tRNA ligase n=1 Tax=Dimargaris verticillata TaxID=2761393 RepID=A0A9W8EBN3_9FUNG|nr:hypothetical protein H4R34_000679 [Dimargaris verticillata]
MPPAFMLPWSVAPWSHSTTRVCQSTATITKGYGISGHRLPCPRHFWRWQSSAILTKRRALWDLEYRQQQHTLQALSEPPSYLDITYDGTAIPTVTSGVTTPSEVARHISNAVRKAALVARVGSPGVLWDMARPLTISGPIAFYDWNGPVESSEPAAASPIATHPAHTAPVFGDQEQPGRAVFWHSSAHILGAAVERLYGDRVLLCNGPHVPGKGYFYDFLLLRSSEPLHQLCAHYLDNHYQLNTPTEHCHDASPLISTGTLFQANSHNFTFLTEHDQQELERVSLAIVNENHAFEQLSLTLAQARRLFAYNPFKCHYLDQIPVNERVTVYRCGDFIDLCRGPHLPSTAAVRALRVTKLTSAHWLPALIPRPTQPASDKLPGNLPLDACLNRVYGISFPSPKLLQQWSKRQDELAQRDHRVIGRAQQLFMFDTNLSPGSVFLLPHGTRIAQRILTTLRAYYRTFGFHEVMTPLVYKKSLWETSGHWQNYASDMFLVTDHSQLDAWFQHTRQQLQQSLPPAVANGQQESSPLPLAPAEGVSLDGNSLLHSANDHGCCASSVHHTDEEVFGLKPMNCPGHCLMFAERPRSYKELPLRYADFSPLHRNESSGALAGLTRVRKFHQDDGHIFCRESQVFEEIAHCLEFLDIMYRQVFKFPNYTLTLSTRPTDGKVVGTLEEWNRAEAALTAALDQTGKPWQLKPGDGAFYGPKIDIMVNDVFDRAHQTATVQLDFQLPRRFALKYQSEVGLYETPVIIHRAILGSLERMLAILIEHYAGKWPFWLSPRQAMVVPVGGAKFMAYAHQVQQWLKHPATYTHLSAQDPSALPPAGAANAARSLVSNSTHDFFHVDVDDDPSRSLSRMVRDAQLARYNFILVVGEKEATTQTVNIRTRDGKFLGPKTIPEVIAMFRQLQADYD